MKRRQFLAGTVSLVVSSRSLLAQSAPRRIGLLGGVLDSAGRDAWLSGLRENGWIEGKNLLVEYRFAETPELMQKLAAELVALTPDLIVALGPSPALALKSVTATVPIAFAVVADPVGLGLVQSLSRPGGNITGLASWVPGDWTAKQIELLREVLPDAARIALLVNPNNPMHRLLLAEEVPRAARKLGVVLPTVEAATVDELETAFASAASQHVDAIIVLGDVLIIREAARVIALAAQHRLPAVHFFRQFADGGLIVYGPDIFDLLRRAGGYVDKILKGAKPSDLPVEQPTKFDLVINMKTAKALGLNVPPSLLVRADEVIE